MVSKDDVSAYILAGGQSSRFGSDKARATIDGQPLIVRIARLLAGCCNDISAVARRGDAYADLGIRTIADRVPDQGPLGGLDAALHDRGDGWILLISCDFVHLRAEWIDLLRSATEGARAVAFRAGYWEPLFALYQTDLKPIVARQLAARELAMQKLLDAANAVAVERPDDWPELAHVNSPLELEQSLSHHNERKA